MSSESSPYKKINPGLLGASVVALSFGFMVKYSFSNCGQKLDFDGQRGNQQLDISDCEAMFRQSNYDPEDVHVLLRGTALHLLENTVLQDGDTTEGPGEVDWQVRSLKSSLLNPNRPVLLWTPEDRSKLPKKFISARRAEA